MSPDSAQVAQYHPIWNSLPTFVWAGLLLLTFALFRTEVRTLLQLLGRRVRMGAGLKLGGFELGQAYVEPGEGVAKGGAVREVRPDQDERRHKQREQYYQPNRQLMLVHRIAPSEKPRQLYDILIYLVPHPKSTATLASV